MNLNPAPTCKRFTGYKPCFPDHDCWLNGCKEHIPQGVKICIINLDAMGDVLMTTAQLPALKRKFPESTIYWVTLKIAAPLLYNNPFIDKVLPFDFESVLILQQMQFDYVLNVDKSQRSGALCNSIPASCKMGFGINENGKIIPCNQAADYNYRLGMDDYLKFKVNTRTGQDYLAETFELDYRGEDYTFCFTTAEEEHIAAYKKAVGVSDTDKIIGFNTGCSNLYPNKKMTVEQHRHLITRLMRYNAFKIVLLGGPEDTERNQQIAQGFGAALISTPTTGGVRMGACYAALPQVVISGDSFGMHLSIALRKYVIAWFGLSCWTEIELYGRGVKLFPEGLHCAPCWKKTCPYNLECVSMIDLTRIEKEALAYFGMQDAFIP